MQSDSPKAKPYGVMGYFETPGDLYHACEELRREGYDRFDAHTPFPVHGLERAMQLPPSKLPYIALVMGALGLFSAIWMTYYMSTDYIQNISGKESFSYQAYVPIYFEFTVLLSALGCFFGLWGLNKLPTFFHPTMTHPSFVRASDDAFFVSIEANDPRYDAVKTKAFLENLGAKEVMEVAS
jgi:hypothetical protein